MYIFLRTWYLRNLRSNELVRSRCYHHQTRSSLISEKKYLHKYVKSSVEYPLKSTNNNFLLTYNPLLCSIDKGYRLNRFSDGLVIFRQISVSACRLDKEPLKPSSKVEVTVQALKDEQKNKEAIAPAEKKEVKKPLKQRIINEIMHYYHGFRLLFIDLKISFGLVKRILSGRTLTRREHNLLVRTVGDLFRLLPFSVFIIVPFMEFALPLYIKFFPGMLPMTFQTAQDREDKLKKHLKVKLEMAKFFQKTLDEMAVQHKDRDSNNAKEFAEWFHKIRTTGEEISNTDIMKFAKLFHDDFTLDSLSRGQLVALCRVLDVQTLGTNNLLRFQLRLKFRNLTADDKLIHKENINSLTVTELQNACKARGMRAYGLSEEKLRKQLNNWLDLSLNQKVPTTLLILSRALMLPEAIPTTDKLKATISVLPDTIVTQASAAILEQEGKIDNKMKLEVIQEEARKVKEERQENREEEIRKEKEVKETLIDKAPIIDAEISSVLTDKAADESKKSDQITSKDLEVLEDALDSVAKNKLLLEKEGIEELKEEMADYQEDLQELKAVTSDKPDVKESKAAKRLFNKVNKMIQKMDSAVSELESKEKQLKQAFAGGESKVTEEDIIRIDELLDAIKKMQKVPNESVLKQIETMLSKIDDDQDGSIKVEDVLKVIELVGKENVQLNAKQVEDIIELIDKEEILEVEDKIEKALQKDAEKKKSVPVDDSTDENIVEDESKVKAGENKKPDETGKTDAQKCSTLPAPPLCIDQSKKNSDSKMI